ncbi:hypothetical protein V6N13_071317 [Hibiscus sabdariffa]|uniref:Uncharacterized protein n=1 Tax=Hibiscus sabdariffa TaxID=183260 RepID=A0ABR2TE54_9ROSI
MKSSASTNANNKRKMSHDDNEEDENIEKFYALIKNIREARDRLITSSSAATGIVKNAEGETKKRKLEEDEEKQAVFVDDKPKEPAVSFAKDDDRREEGKEELDLTLSL